MKAQAINDYVIVEVEKPQEKTEGGLHLPPGQEDKPVPKKGVVVSSAVDSIKKGVTIHFERYSETTEFEDSDKTIELEELCGLIALYSDIPKDKEFSDLMESIVKRNWAEDKLKEQKDEGSISK